MRLAGSLKKLEMVRLSEGTMSQQSSDPTIYDGLMFVSLGAVIVGIVFLIMAMDGYGWSAG